MILSAEEIRAARDLPVEEVDVPEWGGPVLVRGLTGRARDRYEESMLKAEGGMSYDNVRAKLVVRCLVDKDGKRLFEDSDVEWLGEKSATALSRVFDVASRLSGLSKADVETLAKNSDSEGGDALSSPSLFGSE